MINVYEMVTLPEDTPVTVPVEPTVAMAVLLLLHTPPAVLLPSAVAAPAHRLPAPVMVPAAGNASTLIKVIVVAVPQPFAAV